MINQSDDFVHEQLANWAARYQALTESLADGFWLLDGESTRLVDVNDAYARLSGYGREELLTMRISDLDAEESAEETIAHVQKVLREGHDRFESRHRRKDGSIWPVEIVTTYWPEHKLFFAFITDITKQEAIKKELAEIRSDMAKLQRQQIAAQTAAAFAHELSQPLQAIASYSEASLSILDKEAGNLDKLRKAIGESGHQAKRASQFIVQLLELLSVGQLTKEPFDLNGEIRRIIAIAKTEHALRFRTSLRLQENLPMVQANRTHVRQVLLNLLHNGIEAVQSTKTPLPTVSVTVRTRKDENIAQVTIRDNGPGIKPEDAERVFRPFFTTKPNGMGMGLAISRSLIEANNGQMWIDPKENGAAVHFTLPLAPEQSV